VTFCLAIDRKYRDKSCVKFVLLYEDFEVITTVAMKNAVFFDVTRRSLVKFPYVSEERILSIFRDEELPSNKQLAE
jgi:hypothetical protein